MTEHERELLSAAFDGEVTPPEKAQVDEILQSSAEARSDWQDLEQLSGMLKELPRDELPVEFPSQVLKLAEQRTLLPVARPAASARRWLVPLLSIAAAAMILIGGVWIVVWINDAGRDNRLAMGNRPVPAPAFAPEAKTAPSAPQNAPDGAPAPDGPFPPGRSVADEMPLDAPTQREGLPTEDVKLSGTPQPGTFVEMSNGEGEAVRVIVVDSAEGLVAVQDALLRNRVTIELAARDGQKKLASDDALCVVASTDQIEKALGELRKSKLLVEEETAVALADLPPDMQRFFTDSLPRDNETRLAKGFPPAPATAAEKPAAPSPPAESDKKPDAKSERKDQQFASRSRQAPLPAPDKLTADRAASRSQAKQPAASARADKADPSTASQFRGPASVRLIVMVRRPGNHPATQAAPPGGA